MYRPEDDSLAHRDHTFLGINSELETIHSTESSINKLTPNISETTFELRGQWTIVLYVSAVTE